jgi:hypothetical protein
VEECLQTFEPLVTEVHQTPEAEVARAPSLPGGLVRLREVGREARNAFYAAGLLSILSLVLSLVLFLGLGRDALVVWQAGDDRVLVEVP